MVAPHIRPAKRGGRPRTANVREVVNAILYLLGTGCQWRALPKDFPPRSTVFGDLDLWGWDGTSIMRSLGRCASRPARRPALRPRSSTAKASRACPCGGRGGRKRGAQIDPSGGACPRARQSRDPWDAGKTVKGKKRHILVDTLGLVIAVLVHPADVQDREGGLRLLQSVRRTFPFIKRIFADAAYRGEATAAAVRALGQWQIEIVKRADRAQGFRPLRKRWIVERTFAGIGRCRRLAKDFENRTRMAVAYLRLAMIRLMLRRRSIPVMTSTRAIAPSLAPVQMTVFAPVRDYAGS